MLISVRGFLKACKSLEWLTRRIELDGCSKSHGSGKSICTCVKSDVVLACLSVFVCFTSLARSKSHLVCRLFARLAGFFFFLANFRWCFDHPLEKRYVYKGENEDWSNENTNIHSKKHVSPVIVYWLSSELLRIQ